jgi:D-lactate dehydrogenase
MQYKTGVPYLLESILPKERIKSRLIDIIAYASDAGFYYLRPNAIVQPVSEKEIEALFNFSHLYKIPLTFRTAGTSLSGQSITDGILVDLSQYWNNVKAEENGETVRVQPGAIGNLVNAQLKKFSRKIGPDPASINSAMVGGILSNNSSGMCCGVCNNSYHTTKFIRFILPNGKSYSTEVKDDFKRFEIECPEIFNKLTAQRNQILSNSQLYDRIRHKYKTKNTIGYSVNAFIDHEEPLEILAHLLIGAEGTLGFIAEAVMKTIYDYPAKSTALLYFNNIYDACKAIVPLADAGAEAVELMDRASIHSIEHFDGISDQLKALPETAAALLVEFQGNNQAEIQEKIHAFCSLSPDLPLINKPEFTIDPTEQAFLWKIRKGMFPAVGAVRASGSTVILEDIAFPVERLGDAILDLQLLFKKHGYDNAIIFGHAKDGNIHFVITQMLNAVLEVERYDRFLRDVIKLVIEVYDGTLKGEHGTGRNMAPFVETEWGDEVYRIMKELKETIDPENLLNPGVIINDDRNAHISNLKTLYSVEEEVDKCMECGYCEHTCPSRDLTLTPRRRIVVRRELAKLKKEGNKQEYKQLLHEYQYDGLNTCAVDGLCATACPVDINTGALVKRLRKENHSGFANSVALFIAKNFKATTVIVKLVLQIGCALNKILGQNTLKNITWGMRKMIPTFPVWSNQIKPSTDFTKYEGLKNQVRLRTQVIYFPSCISRVMGGSMDNKKSIIETFISVSNKAGINFMIPEEINNTCCGQLFSSKGFNEAFVFTANETIDKIWRWTQNGKLPIVLDVTSCTYTLLNCRHVLSKENKLKFDALTMLDSVDYMLDYILPRATIYRKKNNIVLHPVCSLQKIGIEAKFLKIAKQLAYEVEVPIHAGCCGMAGDRGFMFPELTKSATNYESNEVRKKTYDGYYSSAKTCEMNMSEAVGKNYESIVYLLDECV